MQHRFVGLIDVDGESTQSWENLLCFYHSDSYMINYHLGPALFLFHTNSDTGLFMEFNEGQECVYFRGKTSFILKQVFMKCIAYVPNVGYCTCTVADYEHAELMISCNRNNTVKGVTHLGDICPESTMSLCYYKVKSSATRGGK